MQSTANAMKDFEVVSPPDDSVSALAFSPASIQQNFLIAGSWDNNVRCWEVEQSGKTIPKTMQSMQGPILDVCWHDDGSKVFMASTDKMVKCWDLASNQTVEVASHDAPIKTCNWIKSPQYTCLMTGSWDKTLKFWDTRSPNPMLTINLNKKCYCADVDFPVAVVGTESGEAIIYGLEKQPTEYKRVGPLMKYNLRCVAIFRNKTMSFPIGFALGGVDGRVAIRYFDHNNEKANSMIKCHRSNTGAPGSYQEVHAVNDMKFHPVHGTLATVGSDGTFIFWDRYSRRKLKLSEPMEQSITKCAFNHDGQIFAYSVSYDWAKGHEFYSPTKKNYIFLRPCFEELKPVLEPNVLSARP